MASPPERARTASMRSTMRSSASSQLTRSNSPAPFRPFRTAGWSRRASPYTRLANCRTLPQMNPAVAGVRLDPSIFTMRPFSTDTARLHESGQSRGQAVSTTLRPQRRRSCVGMTRSVYHRLALVPAGR